MIIIIIAKPIPNKIIVVMLSSNLIFFTSFHYKRCFSRELNVFCNYMHGVCHKYATFILSDSFKKSERTKQITNITAFIKNPILLSFRRIHWKRKFLFFCIRNSHPTIIWIRIVRNKSLKVSIFIYCFNGVVY